MVAPGTKFLVLGTFQLFSAALEIFCFAVTKSRAKDGKLQINNNPFKSE